MRAHTGPYGIPYDHPRVTLILALMVPVNYPGAPCDDEYSGHVSYDSKGQPVCPGNPGGLVDCFSRWTEACPLPNKTALAVADAFFQLIVCRFGMPSVIHSYQSRKFENHLMQDVCLLCGAHMTRTTPYHPASDGLVEQFNRTLLMMLAMFAGENRDDWDDLLPAVMMAYRSSVHESTGFSPYRLMFGE